MTPTQKILWELKDREYPCMVDLEDGTSVLMESPKFGMIGGKGCAKTLTAVAIMLDQIQEYPGSRWFVSANTIGQTSDSLADKVVELSKKGGLNFKYYGEVILDGKPFKSVYHFPDFDSYVALRTEENMVAIEGSEWDGCILDECQDWRKKNAQAALSRVRRQVGTRMRIVCGMPEEEDHWQYDFLENAEYYFREIDTRENAHNLPPEYIKELYATYPGDEGERYVHGQRISLRGAKVFKSFDRSVHVNSSISEEYCTVDPYRPIIASFDFNVSVLCVSLWQSKNVVGFIRRSNGIEEEIEVNDALVQIDEFEAWDGIGTRGACQMIYDEYKDHRAGFIVIGDATGNSRDTRRAGITDYKIIAETLGEIHNCQIRRGLVINRGKSVKSGKYSNPPKKDTIQECNKWLKDSDEIPHIFFMPKSKYVSGGCASSVASLKWKATGVVDEKPDSEDSRRTRRTHFADTFRYVVWYQFKVMGKGKQSGNFFSRLRANREPDTKFTGRRKMAFG